MEDSVIKCDEIIEETILMKKVDYKTESFYILLAFFWITNALLIAVSIYCYLIKYQSKQKYLLPFHKK